jgi:hypothetical protein
LPTTPTKNVRSKIGDALKPMVQWFSHVLLSASPSLSASLPLPCSSYHVVLAARRYRISLPSWPKWDFHYWLVVEPSLWKIWKSDWIIIPTIGENKQCSKPPTSWSWKIQRKLMIWGYETSPF